MFFILLVRTLVNKLRLSVEGKAAASAIERIADAEFQIGRNVNMKFVLADLVAGMADDFGVGATAGAS